MEKKEIEQINRKIYEETKKEIMKMIGKCIKCEDNDGTPKHTCPYASDVNNDNESLCNCCDACTHQCAMDI